MILTGKEVTIAWMIRSEELPEEESMNYDNTNYIKGEQNV